MKNDKNDDNSKKNAFSLHCLTSQIVSLNIISPTKNNKNTLANTLSTGRQAHTREKVLITINAVNILPSCILEVEDTLVFFC